MKRFCSFLLAAVILLMLSLGASAKSPAATAKDLAAQGLEAAKTGNLELAVQLFENALAQNPEYAEAWLYLSDCKRLLGRFVEAEGAAKEALRLRPKYAEAHYVLGAVYYMTDRADEALAAYKQAITLKKNLLWAHNDLAVIYISKEQYALAEEELRQALKIQPEFPMALSNLALLYALQDRGAEAIDAARLALKGSPELVEARLNLAFGYVVAGEYEQALEQLERVTEARPNFAEAHLRMGTVLQELKRPQEAISSFQRVLELSPGSPDAYLGLGACYDSLNQLEAAVTAYRRLTAALPDFPDGHHLLGLALGKLGQHEEALPELARAVELFPYGEHQDSLAAGYVALGRYAEAAEVYLQIWGREALDRAIEVCNKAIAANPADAAAHFFLGKAHWKLGDHELALADFLKVFALDPAFPNLYKELGWAYREREMSEREAWAYEQWVLHEPDNPQAHYELGNTYARLGRRESAMETYRKLKELDERLAERLLRAIE